MPRPCGEIAKLSPMRNRSRTGQPMEARSGSTDVRVYRRSRERPGHRRATARPISNPLSDVRRVVHAEVDAGGGHGQIERREPGARDRAEPQLAPRDAW